MAGSRSAGVPPSPGAPSSPPPESPAKPLPHQPHQPILPATKKGRHRKQAETSKSSSTSTPADHQSVSVAQPLQTPPQQPPLVVHPLPFYSPTHRGPVLQPYPGPTFHIMNPPYPINGSPYSQQQQQHSTYPGQPSPPMTATPPGMPTHPASQFPYPVHPQYTYGYPQYGQPMVVYARPQDPQHVPVQGGAVPVVSSAPAAPTAADATHNNVQASSVSAVPSPVMQSSSSASTNKRKRNVDKVRFRPGDKGSDDDASSSDAARVQTHSHSAQESAKKRTKTQRACDSCRARKIRCDIIPESEPPICQHCKQFGFECTFFLPITETRFKKKKLEEPTDKEKSAVVPTTGVPTTMDQARAPSVFPPVTDASKRDVGIFGPTSPAHLLHSQATVHSRIYENYDIRYQLTFEVSATGDGLIKVQKPAKEDQKSAHPKPVDLHIERDVVEKLVNAYFADVAPFLPVVTREEFLAASNPPPILLYSMCLVAAARRDIPHKIFESLRYTVNTIIKYDDIVSSASMVNVQALLILSMSGDCHSPFVSNALSSLWIRLGASIRMAQDLGLHRAESLTQNINLRRRVWAACLISDRWTSLAYGHPYMIDVKDCDVRLPSTSSSNSQDMYLDELVRLSIVLGDVLQTIYSPSGLTYVKDEQLHELLRTMEGWKANLPEDLKFRGPGSSEEAGLLHLLYACVSMLFWRVFMRISYKCPEHLKFSLQVEQWSALVQLTSEAIDWLDAHEKIYDIWLIIAYAATSCALVQYHTWVRRKDKDAAQKLKQLRDCVRRWEQSISPDHMSARRKTAEIITLLYEATQGPQLPIEAPVLNPTGGVKAKPPVSDLDYRKDPTRPGSGVFIAHGKAREGDFEDLPTGIIFTSNGSSSDEGVAPVSSTSNPVVKYTVLSPRVSNPNSAYANVNPALNGQQLPANAQMINPSTQGSAALQNLEAMDMGLLDIPPGMFDWDQWTTYFNRMNSHMDASGQLATGTLPAYQTTQGSQSQ